VFHTMDSIFVIIPSACMYEPPLIYANKDSAMEFLRDPTHKDWYIVEYTTWQNGKMVPKCKHYSDGTTKPTTNL